MQQFKSYDVSCQIRGATEAVLSTPALPQPTCIFVSFASVGGAQAVGPGLVGRFGSSTKTETPPPEKLFYTIMYPHPQKLMPRSPPSINNLYDNLRRSQNVIEEVPQYERTYCGVLYHTEPTRSRSDVGGKGEGVESTTPKKNEVLRVTDELSFIALPNTTLLRERMLSSSAASPSLAMILLRHGSRRGCQAAAAPVTTMSNTFMVATTPSTTAPAQQTRGLAFQKSFVSCGTAAARPSFLSWTI